MLLRTKYPSTIMLHYVSDDSALDKLKPWIISRQSYIRLLDYLQAHNYKTVGYEDMPIRNEKDKTVILTFDDCPKHLFDFAIPELVKRGMKAVFYMPTAHLGGVNEWNVKDGLPQIPLMNQNDIMKLIDCGMEVGSHAHNHIMLEELSVENATEELTKSKQILERIINKEIVSIAYPYGSLPKNHYTLSQLAGYRYGLAVCTPWQSKYAIRRWTYTDEDNITSIKNKMSPLYAKSRTFLDKYNLYKKKVLSALYQQYSRLRNR